MPSFDTVSEANIVEVKNAVDQANKEITTRFDFKGSDARVEQKERDLTAYADSEFQLAQVRDVLTGKMVKRNVDVRFLMWLLEVQKADAILKELGGPLNTPVNAPVKR